MITVQSRGAGPRKVGTEMMGYGAMGDFGWAWMLFGLVFWVTVIALAVRAFARGDRDRSSSPTAEEFLKGRYARGEIDSEQYNEARRTLQAR